MLIKNLTTVMTGTYVFMMILPECQFGSVFGFFKNPEVARFLFSVATIFSSKVKATMWEVPYFAWA